VNKLHLFGLAKPQKRKVRGQAKLLAGFSENDGKPFEWLFDDRERKTRPAALKVEQVWSPRAIL
jgi:hypothetical protein